MYRLLIAEDELWLRKRLVSTIEWASYGISEVYEAEDGEEALRLAMKAEPDILITDIQMPELSGIDLMKILNESSVFPKTIVVSGYDDFEYVQKALQIGAVNYLLKPVEEEELLKTVKKCIEELEQEQRDRSMLNRQLATSQLLMEHVYEELIFENVGTNKNFIALLESLFEEETHFPAKYATIVTIQVRNQLILLDEETEADVRMIHHYVEKSFRESLEKICKLSYSYTRGNQIVLLLFSDDQEEQFARDVQKLADILIEDLQKNMCFQLVLCVGSVVQSFLQLRSSYEATLVQMKEQQKNIDKGNALKESASAQEQDANFEDVYAEYNFKSLIKEIRNGDFIQAKEELHQLLNLSLKRLQNANVMKMQFFYINLFDKIAGVCLPECEVYADELAMQCMNGIKKCSNIGSGVMVTEVWTCLEEFVEKLSEIYMEHNGNRRHWLMDQVVQYVEENYNTPLSTKDIAQRFFVNASYFSKLFHEQMGTTFSNYLISVRMEKAKVMLTQTNMKLYDIAYAVGYTNVQYFSTIFKEKEGTTPSKYRQLRLLPKDKHIGSE